MELYNDSTSTPGASGPESASDKAKADESTESTSDKKKKKLAVPLFTADKPVAEDKKSEWFPPKPEQKTEASPDSLFKTAEKDTDDKVDAKPEASDTQEMNIEELTEEEAKAVTEAYIAERQEVLESELAQLPPDAAERVPLQADADMLDRVKSILRQPDTSAEHAIQTGFEEAADAMAVNESQPASVPSPFEGQPPSHDEPFDAEASNNDSNPGNVEPDDEPPENIPLQHSRAFAAVGSGGPPVPPDMLSMNSTPNHQPNPQSDQLSNQQAISGQVRKVSTEYRTRHRGADVLAGGIVGYLIGRRRGRINTEERMIPVQRKLEREVENLQQTIIQKETTIQTLAKEKASRLPAEASVSYWRRDAVPVPLTPGEAAVPLRSVRPETKTYRALPRVSERIGGVILSKPEAVRPDVRTMPVTELLTVAASIKAEGTSVAKLYEQGTIPLEGVRRIVVEHMSGHDTAAMVMRERIGREGQRERKPERVITFAGAAAASPAAHVGQPDDNPMQSNQTNRITAATSADQAVPPVGPVSAADTHEPRVKSKAAVWIGTATVLVVLAVLLLILL